MKKKSTQFRWLVTMLLLVTAMAMPKMAWAQVKYTVFDSSTSTLTFKYGEKPTGGECITVSDIPDASSYPGWNSSSITTVVFDESFKDARPTTCYGWFQNCTSLTTINGIENLNTENVTDMDYMFYNCSSLSTLDLSGFNTANVMSMEMMFCNCSKLTTIYASSNFITSAVMSSSSMFTGCTSLVGAIKYDSSKTDANYANTTEGYFSIKGSETKPKVAYVVYTDAIKTLTFKYGEKPTEGGDITVYDIPDVSSSPGWNSQASSITTVVFDESFKDARPTRCYGWFDGCTSLTTINGIENLNTEKVEDMRYMFYNCSLLSTLDLSGFNTARVLQMDFMFYGCSKLTTIYASRNFTTYAVTSSSDMFTGCTSLAGALKYDSSKTDANYANTIDGYFSIKGYVVYTDANYTLTFMYGEKPTGGEGITVYDIPDYTCTPGWSSQASSITTVVFDDSFKDARPTTCYGWFDGCTSLTTINGIENLNTEDVEDMRYMFYNCSLLSTLDLSGFNTAKVESMSFMFQDCSQLTTIYASSNFTTSAVTSSSDMFTGCTSLAGAIIYESSKTDANYANTTNGYFSIKGSETKPKGPYVVYTDDDKTLTFKYGEKPTGGGDITVYDIPDDTSDPGWNSQASSITTVVFDESFKDARPTTCYSWFYGCTSLTTINGIENLNTEDVEDMRYMFYNCSLLSTLDLSGFNTAKVESMSFMFQDCSQLTTIYASSNFTTSAVTSSSDMFTGCTSLAGAIIYESSKTDANYANTTDGYFSIKGSETNPKGAYVVYTDADNTLTFKYGEKPTEGEGITVYDIPDSSRSPEWNSQASSITTVVFDGSFKDARPTTCFRWFYDCTSLTTINGIENLNTEDVTNMNYMFHNCSSLTTLDLSGFNTEKVKNMDMMFYGCSNLTTIYASSNFTTSAVTSLSDGMFTYCYSLVGAVAYSSDKTDAEYATTTNGYFKNLGDCSAYAVFNSSNNSLTLKYDTNISQLAENEVLCTIKSDNQDQGWYNYRTSINKVVFEPSFASARPVTCYQWFYECSNLASIEGLEYLNTSEVKSMNKMFHLCKKITTLNLSNFETSQVTDMYYMFNACNALTTIYVSDKFTIDKVTSDGDMFRFCNNLKGASSCIFGNWNKNYANYHTGYFSYGINTVDDLKTFANKVNGTYTPAEGETATPYTAICAGLMANITLTDADNLPAIGSGGYSGTFDGCGHAISGLNFSSASPALFAQNSGTIKNLGIAEATIAESANGSLCQTNSGTIESCFFMGTATGSSQSAGGICQTNNGTITNCYYLADSETDAIEGTTYKTTDQFKSGEVCYMLNEGNTDGTQIWYQNLAAEGDTWPVCNNTGNNTVYYAILFCGGTSNAGNTYANTPKVKIDHDMPGNASLNSEKHIYQKVCKRDGCDHVGYYATSDGTVVANETESGFVADALTLEDATPYDNQAVFTVTDFKYTRTFSNTNWTAWYVPFELKLTEEICSKFAFSRINNVHQYDTDNDGKADKTVVESFRQTEGVTLKANYPYLVKPVSENDLNMELNLKNVKPALAEAESIDCQSVDYKYVFTGTYKGEGESGATLYDPYTLYSDGTWQHYHSLEPMRHYLKIESRNATTSSAAFMRSILLSVIGDENATGIVKIYDEERRAKETYDLGGRRIPAGSQRNGFYIENGKVIYKK